MTAVPAPTLAPVELVAVGVVALALIVLAATWIVRRW